LEIALAILSLGYILEFIVLGLVRLTYPYELEWIEGAKIDEMLRILEGLPIYGLPTIHFIPLSYTPLFFYLSASFMRIFGVGFFAPRLISILSTVGSILLIYAIIRKGTRQHLPGIIGAGLFAGCYQFTGTWMDLVKVDSLFLFLVLASVFIGLEPYHRWKFVVSGILFAAAFFTKQVAFPIFLVFAPISLIVTKGKTWLQWLTACVSGIVVFGILEKTSGGWFSYYTIQSILLHPLGSAWWDFWKSIFPKMWPSLIIALIYLSIILANTLIHRKQDYITSWQYLGFTAALIAGSWANSLKIWSYKNTFLPACLSLAILIGLGLQISGNIQNLDGRKLSPYLFLRTGIIILLFIQFFLLFYDPFKLIPTQRERQAAQEIITRLRNLPGEVLVYNHGFVNYLAGKTTYMHSSTLGDIMVGNPAPESETYYRREMASGLLQQALSEQRFDWLVIDTPDASWPPYYIHTSELIEDNGAKYPGREDSMVPKSLLVRNPISRGGSLPLNDSILNALFLEGWGNVEVWGRWAIGDSSTLKVVLEKGPSYTITIVARSFCVQNSPSFQSMQVLWNGNSLGSILFETCEDQSSDFFLRGEMVNKETNKLHFAYERNIGKPSSDSVVDDSNSPSIAFSLIEFSRK